ncbi:MAG: AAA family ATPase [Polyangiaceae bacterium]|nr:AAA family ATPase [Polyangiaceae bacterium]
MLRSLELSNFRAFQSFSLEGLGQINLCVGTNNCGKTSILEAVSILASRGRPESLWSALARRGEQWFEDDTRGPGRLEVDICHLFYGHELLPNAQFSITGVNDTRTQKITATAVERDPAQENTEGPDRISARQGTLFDPGDTENSLGGRMSLELRWEGFNSEVTQQFLVSRRGGLVSDVLERSTRKRDDDATPVRSITTEALTRDEVVAMFEAIVLTPEEQVVIDALKTIEPAIERIAPIGSSRRRYFPVDRGGIVVKLANSNQRIPIGSMGDGIWRMLGIALSLARARGGILLVDEIDTGFHHSVMASMWRMVLETALRLDVQVFATTHSRDCYESLASISRADASESRVSIQRIERGNPKAVAFSESQIVIAAERAIEVR